MKHYYVSIEKNVKAFENYKALWAARSIYGIRADTMTEGIEKAIEIESSKTDELFFVCIVADETNFMPQLKLLSEATSAPILIATSKANYSAKEHHEALNNGADFYAEYCEKPEKDIDGVLSAINSITQRARKQKILNRVSYGDIHIVTDSHKAFVKDAEIFLTAGEMKILELLLLNRGHALSHKQIFSRYYEDTGSSLNPELTSNIIYSTIKRLRKKLKEAAQTDYIETVRNVGYRLKTKSD